MLHVISVIVYLGITVILYTSILKGRADVELTRKAFLRTFLMGALPCTLCIAVFELSFDRFIFTPSGTFGGEVLTAFFRAALIEEGFKLLFCRRAVKKYRPRSMLGCMLLCGLVGAGYGFSEKLAYGGGVILIANALLPLHIFFQFLMGAFIFKTRTDAAENADRHRPISRAAVFLMPFLVHGLWDALLAGCGYLMELESMAAETAGVLLFAACIVCGVIAEVKTVRRMNAMPGTGKADAYTEKEGSI